MQITLGNCSPFSTMCREDTLEEEEKAPQQPAAACGCQGPATVMCPAAMAGGQGKEHAPATGARQHTARQSKTVRPTAERSDRRGVWGHAATTLHASPRPRLVRHERAPPVPLHA